MRIFYEIHQLVDCEWVPIDLDYDFLIACKTCSSLVDHFYIMEDELRIIDSNGKEY